MDQSLAVEDESGVDSMRFLGFKLKGYAMLIDASLNESNCDWMLFVVQVCDAANSGERLSLNKRKTENGSIKNLQPKMMK